MRALSVLLATALAAASLTLSSVVSAPASPARADTVPIDSSEPASVSGDGLPTTQIDGVAWSQVIIGDTVYVGGKFTTARPAGSPAGTNTVPRSNLLAYNVVTGELVPSFAPVVNGEVRVVTASPDGSRLYIGGLFTSVDGVARYRLAAFDTATGALSKSFTPGTNYTVNSIVASNDTVWFGGGFSSVSTQVRNGAAAVSSATGALLPWAPDVAGGRVQGIVLSPDGTKIAMGGTFTSVNGDSVNAYGLGMVASTGTAKTNLPFAATNVIKNGGSNGGITSLYGNADGIYGTGYDFGAGANFEGAFRASWADGSIVWLEDCHGDTYSVFPVGGLAYTAGHAHMCSNVGAFPETSPRTHHRALAFTTAATGTVTRNAGTNYANFEGNPAPTQANWFPDFNTGIITGQSQGPWNVSGDGRYVVYGGEFTRVNYKAQQGLVRFAVKSLAPNKVGPAVTGAAFVPTATARSAGSVTLAWPANWDIDNELLTYRVMRDGVAVGEFTAASRFWKRPTLTYVDTGLIPGQTYSYSVTAIDQWGNSVTGDAASGIAGSGVAQSAYAKAVLADNPQHYWRLTETSGTAAADLAAGTTMSTRAGVTLNVAGAIVNDPDRAARFSGSATGFAATSTQEVAPQVFSVEAWVRTASTAGGKIIGFGNSSSAGSTLTDRHLYLDTSGRVVFGVFQGADRTISSPAAVNDNRWHHVVATLGSGGMNLYVDGVLSASRAEVTSARATSGYWRVGGDTGWAGAGYLAGEIDEPATYPAPLTPAEVATHFAVGTATPPPNSPPVASFSPSISYLDASFDGRSSTDSDGSVVSWTWSFGDGSTGTGATVTHSYASAGTYPVTLTVTDDRGGSATFSSVVTAATPPPVGVLASDSFDRSVSGGFGDAAVGGAWTLSGGATNFAVAGGLGTMTAPLAGSTLTAMLPTVSSTASDVTVVTRLAEPVVGSPAYVSVIGRSIGADSYRARVVFSPTAGKVNLQVLSSSTTLQAVSIAGLVYAPGEPLSVRVQVTGTSPTTVSAKVWRTGTDEPTAWMVSATDSLGPLQGAGSAGLSFYLGGASTVVPRAVTFDDLLVRTAP